MKFCTSCGSALEFFEFLDGELCSNCLKNKESGKQADPSPPLSAPSPQENFTDMEDVVLAFEDGKLVLKSSEGWVLWSGPASERHKMKTILKRARQILKIRKKRRKN